MDSSDSSPKMEPIREMKFVECDQMTEFVRGGDGEFIQMGRGSCLGSMRQINLEGLEMLFAEVTDTSFVHAAANSAIEVVHLPLRWTGEMHWNGRRIEHPTGIVWGKDPEWSRVATDSSVITLGFRRDLLFSTLEKWTGRDPEESWRFDGQVLNPTDETRNLLKRAREVVELSIRSPEVFGLPKVAGEIRDSLLSSLLAATQEEEVFARRLERVSPNRRRRAVTKANEYLRENDCEDVSIPELCAVTGVSARTLEYAFKEHLGFTPMKYLKIRRLNRARKLLREGAPEGTSVAECAFAAGFAHLGRFSVDYREFFGESPSVALMRSPG